MNYSYIKTIFIVLVCTMTLLSCKKDFLEVKPKGKLIAQATSDYDLLLSNNQMISFGALSNDIAIPMGDELTGIDQYFPAALLRTQRLFRWEDDIYDAGVQAFELSSLMSNIYTYNKIINEVPASTGGTDAEKRIISAQAKAGRAWCYFLLINYYGKPYNSTTASTDPGYPIVTAADVTETKFERANVQAVYDFIVKDLTEAIADLPTQLTHRSRWTKTSSQGMLGKVYMFMAKYNDALPLLAAAKAETGTTTLPVTLYDYNGAFSPGGVFFPNTLFGPTYPVIISNQESLLAREVTNTWAVRANEIVISAATAALFKPSDLRLKFFTPNPFQSSAILPNGMLRRFGPLANPYGILLPEIYLLNAECKARLGNLAGAKADVEALRLKRMPAVDAPIPAAVAADQQLLVKYILDERIREFACAGFRWFDMRRLSVDPIYSSTVNQTHLIVDLVTGATKSIITLKPERLTLRFPRLVIEQNPGMSDNP